MEIIITLLALMLTVLALYHYQYKKNSTITATRKEVAVTTAISIALSEKIRAQEALEFAQKMQSHTEKMHAQEFLTWSTTQEKEIRADANKRSRATMRGQATEHLAPYMIPALDAKDFRFMGDPLDYLVCVGSSAIHDKTTDTIEEVMLLDIKTGKSQLSKVQRRIRDAVVEGRVVFATYNTDTEVLRRWPE